jgi:hypothetical protein
VEPEHPDPGWNCDFQPKVGSWKLEVGSQKLEVGRWSIPVSPAGIAISSHLSKPYPNPIQTQYQTPGNLRWLSGDFQRFAGDFQVTFSDLRVTFGDFRSGVSPAGIAISSHLSKPYPNPIQFSIQFPIRSLSAAYRWISLEIPGYRGLSWLELRFPADHGYSQSFLDILRARDLNAYRKSPDFCSPQAPWISPPWWGDPWIEGLENCRKL